MFTGIVTSVIKSLFTGGITKAMNTYRDIQVAKIKENNKINATVKRLEMQRLKTLSAASINAKEIRIATKDHWEIRLAVGLVAVPTSFHYACVVIDNIYHMGWNVQMLPEPLNEWQGTIVLSYFGLTTVRHGINALTAALLRKGK